MQQAIQFETIIESGFIRIPEQYAKAVPSAVKVTLTPINEARIKLGSKSKAGVLSIDNFSALKIDTRDWKFNREEANERR
jgi:hypothetical protein